MHKGRYVPDLSVEDDFKILLHLRLERNFGLGRLIVREVGATSKCVCMRTFLSLFSLLALQTMSALTNRPQRVVIVGGGIHDASIAYHLSLGAAPPDITIVERS